MVVSAQSESSLVASVLQPVPDRPVNWSPGSRALGSWITQAPTHCSLTTLIEKGPSVTGHALKATVLGAQNHSVVPFKTVSGTHRHGHLQEATVICNHTEEPKSRDSSPVVGS